MFFITAGEISLSSVKGEPGAECTSIKEILIRINNVGIATRIRFIINFNIHSPKIKGLIKFDKPFVITV